MTIETQKYSRRPFDVEAVRVTKTNMGDVADWCKGNVVDVPGTETTKAESFIQVDVHAPANERQSRAFPGDYVLLLEGGKSFKVYTTKAFNKNFVPSESDGIFVRHHASTKSKKADKPEPKPANGIKPEAREALRKMGDVASSVGQAVVDKMNKFTEDANESVKQQAERIAREVEEKTPVPTGKDETPSAPVEAAPSNSHDLPPNEDILTAEERTARAEANREAELQVVERPVEDTGTTEPKLEVVETPDEPEKKKKFIQQTD